MIRYVRVYVRVFPFHWALGLGVPSLGALAWGPWLGGPGLGALVWGPWPGGPGSGQGLWLGSPGLGTDGWTDGCTLYKLSQNSRGHSPFKAAAQKDVTQIPHLENHPTSIMTGSNSVFLTTFI